MAAMAQPLDLGSLAKKRSAGAVRCSGAQALSG